MKLAISVLSLLAVSSAASLTPANIAEAINARPGSTVCEIGAGDGKLSIAMTRIVGPEGRVYANELGESKVQKMRDYVAKRGVSQVTVIAGDPQSTNFPDGACDAVFMRDVYHHFSDPAAMNRSIAAALKPGGRVAVIDFTPPGEEAADPPGRSKDGKHGVTPDTVSRELKEAGFVSVTTQDPAERWFMVVLAKPQT